jgi:RNA recognition motif-containing protein
MDETALKNYFDPQNTTIKKLVLIKNRSGKLTNKALIEFTDKKSCESAIYKFDQNFIETDQICQKIAMKPFSLTTVSRRLKYETNKHYLYIGNLDYHCTPEEFYYFLEEFGEIEYVDLPLKMDKL